MTNGHMCNRQSVVFNVVFAVSSHGNSEAVGGDGVWSLPPNGLRDVRLFTHCQDSQV